MLAPSIVPMVSAPLRANFMLPVPEASVPAVEICSDRSAAGNDLLGQRHAVVGEEDHLEQVADAGVVVDDVRHGVDQPDDQLGHGVAGGGLAAEDDRARQVRRGRVVLDPVVERDDVQHVEELALVLVDALDLHVEQRVGIDARASMPRRWYWRRMISASRSLFLALDLPPARGRRRRRRRAGRAARAGRGRSPTRRRWRR